MSEHRSSNRPSFSFSRKLGVGVEVLIACASVLALVVMLNYLAARHFLRLDASKSQRWTLSPRTLAVLDTLTNDIKVIVYYGQQDRLYKEATDLLREYAARNPFIKLELVDPDRNPVEANRIRNDYHLAALNEKNLVLFDNRGKIKAVHQQALADYVIEPVAAGVEREFRRRTTDFRGEQQFTSALISVISPRQLKAYFLQGHGEHHPASTDEQMGYSRLAYLLTENNLQPDLLTLLGSGDVPQDCSLLIVAGPVDPFSEEETAKIERYLSQGGRLMVLFSYRSFGKKTGLERMLAGWGVIVGESFVLDPLRSTPNARGQDLILTITENEAHPVTRPLDRQSVHLMLPRAVSSMKSGTHGVDVLKVDELLRSSPDGALVSTIRNGLPEINPARDPRGAFSVMAAVERGSVPGVRAERGSTRIIVAGDSIFLSNQMIESLANRDFATHAFNWLVDQTYLLAGIGPRPVKEYKLNLTNLQMATMRLVLLGALPAAVLGLGALVWFKRRK